MSTAATTPNGTTTAPPPALHVHITRFLRAPRERVFAAWTEAEQMAQWKGPANFTCLEAVSDPRVGGRYRIVMRGIPPSRDGEPAHERTSIVDGEYLELRPPELVRYTWNPNWSPGEKSIVTSVFTRRTEARGSNSCMKALPASSPRTATTMAGMASSISLLHTSKAKSAS